MVQSSSIRACPDEVVAPSVSTLKLKSQANVSGGTATLADVLNFSDADSRLVDAIGGKPLIDAKPAPKSATRVVLDRSPNEVTHEQIVQRMNELGVNMSRVLVSGATACQITYAAAKPIKPATDPAIASKGGVRFAAAEEPLIRSVSGAGGTKTLADVLRRLVQDDLADKGGTPQVEFEVSSREFLELTTPPFDFSVAGGRSGGLGLREFKVTIRRDGKTQRTERIGANVKLVRQVLVAAKPLNIGGYITRDSVESVSHEFTEDGDLGVLHPEQIVGQQVLRFVPAGQMIHAKDIKAVDMVKRSQPVTVEGGGAIHMQLNGVALDNGGFGETVRVRLGDARKDRREIRGVVTGVGTVRITEE